MGKSPDSRFARVPACASPCAEPGNSIQVTVVGAPSLNDSGSGPQHAKFKPGDPTSGVVIGAAHTDPAEIGPRGDDATGFVVPAFGAVEIGEFDLNAVDLGTQSP